MRRIGLSSMENPVTGADDGLICCIEWLIRFLRFNGGGRVRRGRGSLQSRQDLVARPEQAQFALIEDQQFVDLRQHAGPMSDDKHRGAALPEFLQRLGEHLFARIVQVGVRFIEQYEARFAVQRAGQADALALAAGQATAIGPDQGVVAIRQLQNQFMHPGHARGSDHGWCVHRTEA